MVPLCVINRSGPVLSRQKDTSDVPRATSTLSPWQAACGLWTTVRLLRGAPRFPWALHKESHLRKIYCSEALPGGGPYRQKTGPSCPLKQTSSSITIFWLPHQTRKATCLSSSCSFSIHSCIWGLVSWSLNVASALLEISGFVTEDPKAGMRSFDMFSKYFQ